MHKKTRLGCKASQKEEKSSERIYRHLWIYTHGIACLCATKTCRFEQADIQEMLTELFLSLLKNAKEQR